MATNSINYVKFLRGTPSAYANLAVKDKNTLYFISEPDAKTGVLYIGDKIVGGDQEVTAVTSIKELSDILIQEGVTNNSFLVYDEVSQKWTNKSVEDVLSSILSVFTGATEDEDGLAGLVPAPTAADTNKFLKGDGTWASIFSEEEQEKIDSIDSLVSTVATLVGDDEADEGKSIKEIAAETVAQLLIKEDADESLDSLQEIADWIQQHPKDAAEINSNILELQGSVKDLEEVLFDTVEKVVDPETQEETEQVVSLGLQSIVANLVDGLAAHDADIAELQETVSDIQEALCWHDLEE